MYNDPIGNATLGGLATSNLGYARTQASQREYLALEVEQQKINLRHAELRLKQHDEWEAERKEMESQVVRVGAFGNAVNRNFQDAGMCGQTLNSQVGQAE